MASELAYSGKSANRWRQIEQWAIRVGLGNKLAIALTIAAIVAGVATYAALTELPWFGTDPQTVYWLLNLDLVLLLALTVLIAWRIVSIWTLRRKGLAGSRLHIRLVVVFGLLAVAPAIIMAIFSAVFFQVGIQSWFNERVSTAVNESLAVAEAYVEEHRQLIRADALAMASDINREAPRVIGDEARFNSMVRTQALLRNLTEAIIVDGSGRVLARSGLTFSLEMEPLPTETLAAARTTDVVLQVNESEDRVRALVHLDRFVDTYLYVGRMVDPSVVQHMERAQTAVQEYTELQGRASGLRITLTLIFVVVSLLLLLAAIWMGLTFATRLATPISNLIGAAERVRAGDLTARVPSSDPKDEIGILARAFNRMTSQLEGQRRDLVEANRQLDHRRRFTEAVLSGVSSGVVGLDEAGRVNLVNVSASELLGADPDSVIGHQIADFVPDLAELLDTVRKRPARLLRSQIQLKGGGTSPRTLLVRIAAEQVNGDIRGFVVTFDDITELLSAQRKAAWADVARRIAHEIKNPLTPIQLSAERLQRRYLKQIETDPETFQACTETIVRQVGDIGRMIDEFSAFARMPHPVMRQENLVALARQAVVLQEQGRPEIAFRLEAPDMPVEITGDSRQINQALTNLLQNAVDSIEARIAADRAAGREPEPGRIVVFVTAEGVDGIVSVLDNGRGLPDADRDRLTEPYVTSREKGTGLGLAIVKKIMEDHGGALTMEDAPDGGARVSLVFSGSDGDEADPDNGTDGVSSNGGAGGGPQATSAIDNDKNSAGAPERRQPNNE